MTNIAVVMKKEIQRLARKEIRGATEGLKGALARQRAEIAALKRQLSELEKVTARLGRSAAHRAQPVEAPAEGARLRFTAKGFASRRQKLGLSAAEVGTLIGVSAQTVYNWESGKARPRPAQLPAIAALRTMGKREIKAKLQTQAEASE